MPRRSLRELDKCQLARDRQPLMRDEALRVLRAHSSRLLSELFVRAPGEDAEEIQQPVTRRLWREVGSGEG
jgi:hypothetical protein